MPKEIYEVKNKAKDARKFRDSHLGKDIIVEPKKSVLTHSPPEPNEVWEVSLFVEKAKKKVKGGNKNREDDSSSN